MQFDAVLNKVGYHYPQQRIVALWQDVKGIIQKTQAPEPLVMRLNTFDCAVFHHSNLVPEFYEVDDYQVRTPTDVIGQHIHLPKWDLTTTDGAGNGWNYEDGTLRPDDGARAHQRHPRVQHLRRRCMPATRATVPAPARCPRSTRTGARSPANSAAPSPSSGRVRARRSSAGSPTRWSTPRVSTAAWASSSRTTTTVRRPTSRSVCTPRC